MRATSKPIKFGLTIQPENVSWPEMRKLWQFADDVGFDTAFTSDHMISVLWMDKPDTPCMDGWTVLTGAAAVTKRIRLGVMITGVTYRHPSVLAKMAATVDHISNGRLILGIGAAWNVAEHTAYGIPFYPNAERIHRLREAVRIIKSLWTQERTTIDGRFYQIKDAPFSPKPLQRPRPPIWIGGWGEKLTLKVVAEEADGWNVTGSPSSLVPKIEALQRHCDTANRDMDGIEKSVMFLRMIMSDGKAHAADQIGAQALTQATRRGGDDPAGQFLLGSTEEMKEHIGKFIDLGFSHFIPVVTAPYDYDALQRFAEEVIPTFRQ